MVYADFDSDSGAIVIGDGSQEMAVSPSEAEDLIDRLNEILLEHPE
jgi:hypothetical protein